MRHPRTGRFPETLKASAVAVSLALLGVAGTQPAPAGAAVRAGTEEAAAPGALAAPSTTDRLRALEASFKGRIGVYALDTGTGKTIAYRAGERFPLLSTFKTLAAAAVLHKARTSDPGLMDRVVHWKRSEVRPASPVTSKHLASGLSVARLCEAAITRSDNTAANMILKQIGGPAGLTRYIRSLKDPITRLDRWETTLNDWHPKDPRDTTTPASMGRHLRNLAVGDTLDAKDRARLDGWLRATKTGDNRIRAGLPKSWIIGDKTGTGSTYGAANDIAVAWPAKNSAPLVIAIYTTRRAAGAPSDEKVIADTAAIVARGLGRLR
jgi:beta-lactamase class A